MIKGARGTDFQALAKYDVELHPGVNCFVGESDVGKSAFLKTIKFVSQNRPSGDAFIREGQDFVSCFLDVAEGSVERTKGEKKQVYKIVTEKESKDLTAFGTSVPEEVSDLLRLDPEINFQGQFDKHFLLSWTPGEVGRFFNRIVNLEKMDYAVSSIQKTVNSLSADIKANEALLVEHISSLDQYTDLDEAANQVNALDQLNAETDKIKEDISGLSDLLDNSQTVTGRLEDLKPYKGAGVSVLAIRDLFGMSAVAQKYIEDIQGILKSREQVEKALSPAKRMSKCSKAIEGFQEGIAEIQTIQKSMAEIEAMISSYTKMRSALFSVEAEQAEFIAEREKLIPDECPLCKQPVGREVFCG